MRTVIFIAIILWAGSCFAGDKVFTDDDIQKYYTPDYRDAQRYNESVFQQKKWRTK